MRVPRWLVGPAAIAVLAAAAPPATAAILLDDGASWIGRVADAGTGARPKLIRTAKPWAVAADRKFVYWARLYCCGGKTQFIGRARLDGSQVQQAFVTIPGLGVNEGGVTSVAVDAGHIYWTNGDVIGRANLDGSNVQSAFIPLGETTQASQVQVSGGKLYFRLRQAAIFSIGRADASGANVVLDFIPNIPLGAGLAVDAGHIYWTQGGPVPAMRSIARADLDGSHVIPRFIAAGLHGLDGLAIDAGHIYRSTFPAGRIERARIDGTRVEHGFARGVRRAHSLAVAPVTVSQ